MLTVRGGNNAGGQAKVVKCYNCQGEGHMARQCSQPKRPKNAAWFKEKTMLAEAQEAGQILDEEQLTFLADPDVISGVPHFEPDHTDMDNQSVHAMQSFEQTLVAVQDNNLYAQQDSMILSVIEQIVISSQHVASHVFDDEETLILEEVSRSKMLAKQNDPISKEKKANKTPINYAELNRLSEDLGKRFVPQQELSDEQAFCLKKLKYHLGQFDTVVKKRITPDAITEGEWGFEHTKAVFLKEIIPFLKTLKDIFNVFDKDLLNEVTKVQTFFNQMEAVVQQYFIDKQCFEIHKKELFLENDRLVQKIMSQDVMICVMNSIAVFDDVNAEMQSSDSCVKCVVLDAELLNKQNAYNDLSKSYSQLKKHCISLELTMQLNQEIFQKDSLSNNQNALEILEYFENNDLKAQLQSKDTTIYKLKEHIKSMRENVKEEKVKHEMGKIETINIELEHSVAKLISENDRLHKEIKHLKKIYEDQFDSIKKTRALSMEHDDSLIGQLNSKSMENADLKRQIQDKESLVYVRDTCPNAIKLSEKKVAITPMNKVKKVRFSEPLTSSSNIKQTQPTSNKKNDRISQKPSSNRKNKVEAQPKKVNKKNRVKEPIYEYNVKHTMLNANSQLIYVKCKQCMFDANHDVGFLNFVNDVNMHAKSKSKSKKSQVVQIILWYLDSGCSKHMTGNRSHLVNFVSKFLGIVRFENDQVAKIIGFGDYQLGNVIISRVYYAEGLGHNLFFVRQFCDADLEVAFQKNTCFIQNLEGVDLLSRSRDTNLYTISLDDMLKTSPICLLSKASK
ncbi:retrovirus-related pol polyprotein from transposon TNT 1-94, partial [Tanacetum coccineum]